MRRPANQVHKTFSRLLAKGHERQKPAWFNAVLEHPPVSTPPRGTPERSDYDSHSKESPAIKNARTLDLKRGFIKAPQQQSIVYLEDEVRQMFFTDHPFEAWRARTLVENGFEAADLYTIPPEEWKTLRDAGRRPTSEDCVRFTVVLHKFHGYSLQDAYRSAVTQFRALKSEVQIANATAALEAEWHGAQFGENTEAHYLIRKQREQLASFLPKAEDKHQFRANLPWAAIWEMPGIERPAEEFTYGETYVEQRDKGEVPNYRPIVEEDLSDFPTNSLDLLHKVYGTPDEDGLSYGERMKQEQAVAEKEENTIRGKIDPMALFNMAPASR